MKIFKQIIVFNFIFLCNSASVFSQTVDPQIKTSKAVMDDFMDKRFGMFIHWGPVALRGTEIGWSRNKLMPQAEYDNLYKEFNPVLFDAYAWVLSA